jgi:hypothetical protein
VWKTAFLERLNGTFRERLGVLTRPCRHAACRLKAVETGMPQVGCTSNLCVPHHEVSKAKHLGSLSTRVMAAGLTDYPWSIADAQRSQIAPLPWVAPTRSGRPRTSPQAPVHLPRRALLRLREGAFCPSPDS